MQSLRNLSDVSEVDAGAVYDDYVATTTDPGNTLFIIAVIICVSLIAGLPFFVELGKSLKKRKKKVFRDDDAALHRRHPPLVDSSDLSLLKRWRKNIASMRSRCCCCFGRRTSSSYDFDDDNKTQKMILPAAAEALPGGELDKAMNGNNYPHPLPTPTPLCSVDYLCRSLLWTTVMKYDNETKRILHLAVPFTISSIISSITELITVAIISRNLGTDAMVAYVMVNVTIGISSSFTGGWLEALSSLGSMAYGAENYELVGQYVQASCLVYVLCEIPMALAWGFGMADILLWMGFSEDVAALANTYVWVQLAANVIGGVHEGMLDFLEVIEYETYANVMGCISCLGDVVVILFCVRFMEAPSLTTLGLIFAGNEAFFLVLNLSIPLMRGWLEGFTVGLFRKFAFSNRSILKELMKVALPLSFGNLIAYAEWEILIIFAAFLGPAECAAWACLGLLWDMFESTTSALGDASEIRVAYQLGKGRPELAKISAYKSIFMSLMVSLVVTAAFLSVSSVLPAVLTTDATLQAMLSELFPLIALGNVSMNMGMTCWTIVGAQGRYKLATLIATACSLFITVPIAALLTLKWNIDLQGLTFSIVVGYSMTAAILTTLLLMTNWTKLSDKIQRKMAEAELLESSNPDLDSDDGNDEDEDEVDTYSRAVLIRLKIAELTADDDLFELDSESDDESVATTYRGGNEKILIQQTRTGYSIAEI